MGWIKNIFKKKEQQQSGFSFPAVQPKFLKVKCRFCGSDVLDTAPQFHKERKFCSDACIIDFLLRATEVLNRNIKKVYDKLR